MTEQGGFLQTCRMKAAEELEAEIQEDALFDEGADGHEATSLRKQAVAWFSAALPWASAAREAEQVKKDEKVRYSLGPHAEDLQEVLLEFDRAYDRLWRVMTDINTELLMVQGLQSNEFETTGLASSLRAVEESHPQFTALQQAAGALIRIRHADQESYRALGVFHQDLERLLSCEVWSSQEAVVALEKAKGRMDMANTRFKALRKGKDRTRISDAKDNFELMQKLHEAQAAIVEEMLPEVMVKIDGAMASGLSNYLRAQHRRFRSGCSALEAVDFSLPTLESAADKGLAGSLQRGLLSKRRTSTLQDQRGGSVHRLITTPADNFAVARAITEATALDGGSLPDAVLAALARLLDDVDTGVPMVRAAFRLEVLQSEKILDDNAHVCIAALASGRVCKRLVAASVKVSCQDKKGSRYGPHALEQAMTLLCMSITPESLVDFETDLPADDTKKLFSNNSLAFCRTIIDSPLESTPGVLRSILCYARQQLIVRGASLQVQRTTLYGIFALCYICPALHDPAAFGISGFPQPFSTSARELFRMVASGLEHNLGLGEKRNSKRQLSASFLLVLEKIQASLGEFCLDVLSELRDLGAPNSSASGTSMQPMSGQSFLSGASFEDPVMSPDVLRDLEQVANFAITKIQVVKDILERLGYPALALAFEEEILRRELALREEIPAHVQESKRKIVVKSSRVCTLPSLAKIKGGKGRIFGLKYRELRPGEEGSDDPSDEDVPVHSLFPSMVHRTEQGLRLNEGKLDDDSIGVGLKFESDNVHGYLRVKMIVAGGPAERCGIIDVGDILVDVAGQNIYVHDDPLEVLRSMILGRAGTVVDLGLQKPGSGQVKRVKLRRAECYCSDAKSKADVGPSSIMHAATSDHGQPSPQVRPRVRVRTTFTRGQSEHKAVGEAAQSFHARQHGFACAPGGPRGEADAITSTGSVGSEKFELSGVGVSLKIGDDEMLYVQDILAGGPAERNGCLSHGDRLVAINDVNLEGKCFQECSRILNGSMGTVANLDLVSLGDFGSSEPQVKRITLRRTWVPDLVWNVAGDQASPSPDERESNGSESGAKNALQQHGVGITFTKTQNDSFAVKRVTEGGPADLAGTIKSGDVITTVDGVSVERKSYRQFARMILGPLGSIVQLGIERGAEREQHLIQLERGPASSLVSDASNDSMSSVEADDEPTSHRRTVSDTETMPPSRATKHLSSSQMVGVGLKCNLLEDGRFVVAGLQPGGPSARSGKIFLGDEIRAVCGVDLAGKSKAQLRDMLMGYAGTDVHLKIVHVDGSAENLNIVRETSGSPSKVSESELIRSGGNKGDLGIRFQRIQDGLLRVCGIQEGGGAFQSSGIHVGDAISFIDDVRVVDLDDQTIHSLFCGVPGSTVKLTVLASDSSERTVEVVRTLVKNTAFSGEMPLEAEQSFDVGSEYGDDSDRGSRIRKTGLGISIKSNHTGMIIVRSVKEGGPAERLGIREGDTIIALDGQQLQNMYSDKDKLAKIMLGHSGSRVNVTLQRKGQTKVESVVLTRGRDREEGGSSHSTYLPITPQDSWMSTKSSASGAKFGLGLTFVKPDGQPGVVVKRVKDGGAAAAGGNLVPGDRLMQIDGDDLPANVDSKMLTALVMGHEGSIATLKVKRSDGAMEEVSVERRNSLGISNQSKYELRSEPSLDFSVSGESRRGRHGLGITFKPREKLDTMPGMIIKRIKDDGPAVRSGIKSGDRLLAVNGIPLSSSCSPSELRNILLGDEGSRARLHIQKADGSTIDVEIIRGEDSFNLQAENSRESVTSSIDSEAASDISTEQDVLVGIGLTFYRPDGLGGVLVKRVKDGSPAAEDVRIAPGVRLYAIDGQQLGPRISHAELTRMVLGEEGSLVTLQVQNRFSVPEEITLRRRRSLRSPVPGNPDVSTTRLISVGGEKLCGLGVTFFPPADGDHCYVIKRVKAGGGAAGSGKIKAGDHLVAIDGHQVNSRLSESELKSLLLGVPGSMSTVRIKHNNGSFEDVQLFREAKELDPKVESDNERGMMPGIASEKSIDEIGLLAAASRGERRRKVGLGMVLNEDDGGEGLVVRKVKMGSASARSKLVRAGDRLISIDGTSLSNLGRQDIEKLVMRPAGSTSICVVRHKDGILEPVVLHRPSAGQIDHTDDSASDAGDTAAEDDEDVQKPVGLGMVFLVPDGKGGRVVKRLKEGSAADAHGQVLPGDRCLMIEGKPIDTMTDRELSDINKGEVGSTVVVVLKSRGGVIKECVLKRRTPVFDNIIEGCGSELSYDSSIASGLTVSDTTGRSGLGLTFHDWKSSNIGMRVKRVKKRGAADDSGMIHPGDIVCSIDGTSLQNIEHRALLKLLMGPEGSIAVLNLVKPGGQRLQVILTRAPRVDCVSNYPDYSPDRTRDELMSPDPSPNKPEMQDEAHGISVPECSLSLQRLPSPTETVTPRVLRVKQASPIPEGSQQRPVTPPAQVPRVLETSSPNQGLQTNDVPVASACVPMKAAPLPPPRVKPQAEHYSDGNTIEDDGSQEHAVNLPSESDFKTLIKSMGAALTQVSGIEEDVADFGNEDAADNFRDDLSEVSLDDSVLGDCDDEDGVRRQCGLGVTFRRRDGKGGVLIKRVKPGGGAESEGSLEPGDRVLRLDGQPLDNLSEAELAGLTIGDEGSEVLLEIVKEGTGKEMMISITRVRSVRGLSFADKEVREYSLVSGQLSHESSREDLGEEGDLEYKDGRKVPRITRTGLGLTFRPPDGKGGVLVKRVKEDGPARGIVIEGDRIVSIDDWPLNDITNQDLVRLTLGIPGTEAVLKIFRLGVGEIPDVTIVRPDAPADQAITAAASQSSCLSEGSSDSIGSHVSISSSVAGQVAGIAGTSKQCGIGLTFCQKPEGGGVKVKRIKEEGAAAIEGSIAADDVVISIDDIAMSGLDQVAQSKLMMGEEGSLAKVVVLKHKTNQLVTVELKRRRTSMYLAENSSESIGSTSSSQASLPTQQAASDSKSKSCGIGLTFLKVDKQAGGLPVKRVKEGGAAAFSNIAPGDIVLSIDGVGLGNLDTAGLTKVMMGKFGSSARLEILKRDGTREIEVLLRGEGTCAQSENSTESVGSASSLNSDVSTSSSIIPAMHVGGERLVGIGLTFLKVDKASGGLPVKRIKEDGAAVNSAISPGDIVVKIDGIGPVGTLDSKTLNKALMGRPGSSVEVELLKQGSREKEIVVLSRVRTALPSECSAESVESQASFSSSVAAGGAPASGGEKLVGIGLTFLKTDKISGGLPVKRIKEDGAAVNSAISPGDIVVKIDGIGPVGTLDSKTLNKALMGRPGSSVEVELLKKDSRKVEIVHLIRGSGMVPQASSDSIGSEVSVAASEVSSSSISSSPSSSSSKVALGFTYKAGKDDGKWRVSTIKGGWAKMSGMVKSQDVIVSVDGRECEGLNLKAITSLLQGPEGSTVALLLERDGATFSAEGKRIKT